MAVVIPDEVLQTARMTEAELVQEIAVLLFQKEKLTLAQASRLAAMPRIQFQHLLASRKIPVHYDIAELESDIQTLKEMGFRGSPALGFGLQNHCTIASCSW